MSDPLFWLSFADDEQFRGAAIVRAHCFACAANKATQVGRCVPGDQVQVTEIPDWTAQPAPEFVGYLMGGPEIRRLQAAMKARVN